MEISAELEFQMSKIEDLKQDIKELKGKMENIGKNKKLNGKKKKKYKELALKLHAKKKALRELED